MKCSHDLYWVKTGLRLTEYRCAECSCKFRIITPGTYLNTWKERREGAHRLIKKMKDNGILNDKTPDLH